MTTRWVAVLGASLVAATLAGAAQAQVRIDSGSNGYFGGYSNFGGYYDTFGNNGGFGGNSGYGSYRRTDTGASSTTNSTGTILTLPTAGGADSSNHCAWLRGRVQATHQKKWRQRYAACLNDYK